MTINLEKLSSSILIREPTLHDEEHFVTTMARSQSLHHPYLKAPSTSQEFQDYYLKYQQTNNKSYLALNKDHLIIGVFNINDMVHGVFQSAYMGYFASIDFAGQGLMSKALKLVLHRVFTQLNLHRIEANIQPTNKASIHLATKNGFQEEGYSPRYLKINEIWCDHIRFALTYEDWITL
ncbi:GNAT family N-acetyltransferase [Legionella bononiensis]|uniref:GNAT family N-acetyltransferase n=1 Tax=Legionella bononiensis TaxID=2793102 RepID=A0ABS1W796_9GAMM|nr:GNAT family protein [Legionella bononiensis]MBL7481324.1 GNAT family N-acetyltransferase [Legionella bononiensis]MBL7525228.1 GNAT family N-acetyltransferase [Legionella bononiensis]MBL7561412.1 GNAT family N-acetyltransferase [Legionella bononiensis]